MKTLLFLFLLFGSILFTTLLIDTVHGIIHDYRQSYLCGITCSWASVIILSMYTFTCSLGSHILYSITKDQLK